MLISADANDIFIKEEVKLNFAKVVVQPSLETGDDVDEGLLLPAVQDDGLLLPAVQTGGVSVASGDVNGNTDPLSGKVSVNSGSLILLSDTALDRPCLLPTAVRTDDGAATIPDGTSNTFLFGERHHEASDSEADVPLTGSLEQKSFYCLFVSVYSTHEPASIVPP